MDSKAAGIGQQIPRNSLALLMLAQAAVVIPFSIHLSPWIIAVCLFCGCWRWMVFRGRWDFPRHWIKAVLVAASIAGVAVSGVSMMSLEAASSLCVLAFALKTVEMKNARDAYVVSFLGYFNIATQFLFDQSLAIAAYELGATTLVTAGLIGLNQRATRVNPMASIRIAGTLIVQALPLTIVFFLLFPRIAPLWTIPLPSGATTGISDRMKPGDIANLTQSDEIAFRAVFRGQTPSPGNLYWRGLVYSDFERGEWSVGNPLPAETGWSISGNGTEGDNYVVLLEPTFSRWLFALDVAEPRSPRIGVTRDYRLESAEPVMSLYRYQVESFPGRVMDAGAGGLAPHVRERALALPQGDNPRIVEYARQLRRQHAEPAAMARAVLDEIRTEPFAYTLRPATLNELGSVDQFWFDTRQGFCTHYAGAFVYIMRAAGVPARMVGGYQGGELNPFSDHLVVRQYDAHAWAEMWVRGQGWVRLDPTAAIAPARIESGLSAALPESDLDALSALTAVRLGEGGFAVNALRWLDSVEHRWNLWVLGYDTGVQRNVLRDLLGEVTPMRIGIALLAGSSISMALVAAVMFWRRAPRMRHPVERAFRSFANVAEKYGYRRDLNETPSAFVRRVGEDNRYPVDELDGLIEELDRLLYNPSAAGMLTDLRALKVRLFRLRLRLVFGGVG